MHEPPQPTNSPHQPPAVGDVGVRIEAPSFVAGLEARDGRVIRAAPILKYMIGWDGKRVAEYCQHRGWSWQRL